jgi:hypothetical protein
VKRRWRQSRILAPRRNVEPVFFVLSPFLQDRWLRHPSTQWPPPLSHLPRPGRVRPENPQIEGRDSTLNGREVDVFTETRGLQSYGPNPNARRHTNRGFSRRAAAGRAPDAPPGTSGDCTHPAGGASLRSTRSGARRGSFRRRAQSQGLSTEIEAHTLSSLEIPMKSSESERIGGRCPRYGANFSADRRNKGFVRHLPYGLGCSRRGS